MRFDSTPVKCISGLKIVVRLEFLCILFQLFCYAPLRPFVSSFLVLTRVTSESRVVSWCHVIIRPQVNCTVAVVPRHDASPITDHKDMMQAPLARTIVARVWQVHAIVLVAILGDWWRHKARVTRRVVGFPDMDRILFRSLTLHPLQLKVAAGFFASHVTLRHSSLITARNAFLSFCLATCRGLTVLTTCTARQQFRVYIPRVKVCFRFVAFKFVQHHLGLFVCFKPVADM
mmetsp:Transcript_60484/g.119872  ORF Transcript_60484/g.119872 Transcript_60484/m.119872 type:complete len:231 (-) Transcript_60484:251-943(-)